MHERVYFTTDDPHIQTQHKALIELLETRPTTIAGCAAALRYLAELIIGDERF